VAFDATRLRLVPGAMLASSSGRSARTFSGMALCRGMPEIGSKSRSTETRRAVVLAIVRTCPSSSGSPPRACAIETTPGRTSIVASATP
jgi:hypothetical protein